MFEIGLLKSNLAHAPGSFVVLRYTARRNIYTQFPAFTSAIGWGLLGTGTIGYRAYQVL